MSITAERARELLYYNPETGIFRLKKRRGRPTKSGNAGCINPTCGYIYIGVDRKILPAHSLAWLILTGSWPKGVVDHINGVKTDNRAANLRDVSIAVNNQNLRKRRKDNTSGFTGVSRAGRKWMANINLNNQQIYLGAFDSPEEAYSVYITTKRKIHEGCTF